MILKFQTDNSWIYHETTEVRVQDELFRVKDLKNATVYSDGEEANLLHYYKNDSSQWQAVLYKTGYLLSNDGTTINALQ